MCNVDYWTNISRVVFALGAVFIGSISPDGCARKETPKMDTSQQHKTESTPARLNPQSGKYEKATFAAGCFWGVEAAFRPIEGVIETQVGYIGGRLENPTYKQVCTDRTGHAEAVEVTYDPNKVSYEGLLEAFWRIHDPTTLNCQDPDIGTQYRSAIFFHTPQQQTLAENSKQNLQKTAGFTNPIVTQIVPAPKFYRAEEYHQRYLEKRGQTSCTAPAD